MQTKKRLQILTNEIIFSLHNCSRGFQQFLFLSFFIIRHEPQIFDGFSSREFVANPIFGAGTQRQNRGENCRWQTVAALQCQLRARRGRGELHQWLAKIG